MTAVRVGHVQGTLGLGGIQALPMCSPCHGDPTSLLRASPRWLPATVRSVTAREPRSPACPCPARQHPQPRVHTHMHPPTPHAGHAQHLAEDPYAMLALAIPSPPCVGHLGAHTKVSLLACTLTRRRECADPPSTCMHAGKAMRVRAVTVCTVAGSHLVDAKRVSMVPM